MSDEVLVARGLRKAYGDRVAVQEVGLVLRAGEVLGLLGPNGAGKSTTVGMICGLTVPDAGTVTLSGGTPGVPGVPEPATWALLIGGIGATGGALRRRKTTVAFA